MEDKVPVDQSAMSEEGCVCVRERACECVCVCVCSHRQLLLITCCVRCHVMLNFDVIEVFKVSTTFLFVPCVIMTCDPP